jgi:alcohol dehydrogenase (NADP+)
MLQLTAKKNIKPWIEKRPLKDANKAIMDMTAGKARYRYTLVNEAHA